jgi:sulfate/thiosulfate transport system substrate-binding protein
MNRWKPSLLLPVLILAGLVLFLAWPRIQEARKAQPHQRVVVVYGFSILGEAMNQGVFPEFSRRWKEQHGEELVFTSSFAGSGTITNQIVMGAPAAMAILSHEGDALRLKEAGAVATDWHNFPAKGIVNQTSFVILVRKGNPKNIKTFADLARPGIGIIHPDPLTSGGAKWSILAEFVSASRHPMAADPEDQRLGKQQLLGIWKNVVGQSPSAAGARTQFENGLGDALITYEQQGLLGGEGNKSGTEVVRPPFTILSQHPLVLVDRNIRPHDRPMVEAFRDFLFSDAAQAIFVRYGFRSALNPSLDSANPDLPPLSETFTVDEMGGWAAADARVYEKIWKGEVLKELRK